MGEKVISYRDLLVMLAGLKVHTPEKGFTSEGQIRAHIEAGLKSAHKLGQEMGRDQCPECLDQ